MGGEQVGGEVRNIMLRVEHVPRMNEEACKVMEKWRRINSKGTEGKLKQFNITNLSQVINHPNVPVLEEEEEPATFLKKDLLQEQGMFGRVYSVVLNKDVYLNHTGIGVLKPEVRYVLKEFRSMVAHRTGRLFLPLSSDFKAEVNLLSKLRGRNL